VLRACAKEPRRAQAFYGGSMPDANELDESERPHVASLILDDIAGVPASDIAQARAIIAGLRGARRF